MVRHLEFLGVPLVLVLFASKHKIGVWGWQADFFCIYKILGLRGCLFRGGPARAGLRYLVEAKQEVHLVTSIIVDRRWGG